MNAAQLVQLPSGRHDPARRRHALRKGREKGCSIYISAEELRRAGVDPNGPAPWYRVWPGNRGGVTVQLYREG